MTNSNFSNSCPYPVRTVPSLHPLGEVDAPSGADGGRRDAETSKIFHMICSSGRAVPNGRANIDQPAHALAVRLADRAVPNGVTSSTQLAYAKGVGTAHPPGAHFLVMQQESGERSALRGDAECHAPACQAALP